MGTAGPDEVAAPPDPRPLLRRGWVRVDCHMHTVASGDSVSTVDEIVERAMAARLDVIFLTDHHEISAALDAQRRYRGVRILVGEEIRTLDGEVLGLFLRERVPYVLPLDEVVQRVRGQGGLVCLPHPFDPVRRGLGAAADELCTRGMVDAVETFNAKTRDDEHNRAAAELARRHGLPAFAGSDAHDPAGIGAAFVEMPDFDSPATFLAGLRQGRIVGEYRAHAPRFVPPATAQALADPPVTNV